MQHHKKDPHCIISGGGVAGLLLALSLANLGLKVSVYEQADEYGEGVGGAIGLYANGLRIIRDISPDLLKKLRSFGRSYVFRKWFRHDGTIVAVAEEKYLVEWENEQDEKDLSSIGIRRWRLQKVLADACLDAGIEIFMNSRINAVKHLGNGRVECTLADKTVVLGDLIFGCDGVKSAMRTSLFGSASNTEPKYTGITCLMGSAPIAGKVKLEGICFPSSSTTNCHACYYPCNDKEIIFQLYFPTEERPETWKPLTGEEGKKECLVNSSLILGTSHNPCQRWDFTV
jgi:2-polyprenyl-6-methoxyphenol hydroxylase-like FAD-dependent oxidoreductase